MNYCIYLRKSRQDAEAEARGEGETLARHERILIDLAKHQKLPISKIYREIVSGETIAARPVVQQLLADVEQGLWDGVLVMEVERLARGDTIDQGIMAQTFKYSNTKIITPTKTYDPNNEFDEEYFEFGLFMSRREYKTINRRLQQGRVASVKEGKYVANQPPYGYVRQKLEQEKGYTLIPNPQQADVVKLIFQLYTVGELQPDGSYQRLGTSMIKHRLDALKIPPKKGVTWSASSIRDILINPIYIGKLRWNWRPHVKKMVQGQVQKARPRSNEYLLTDGRHEAIIDDETFALAQKLMADNPPNPVSQRYTVKNPLSGLVVCGKCGRSMVRRPYRGKPDILMCQSTDCDNVSAALHFVESRILDSLAQWLEGYKLRWKLDEKPAKTTQLDIKTSALQKIQAEITTLKKQSNNIYDLLEQGVYDTETFLERSKHINSRIAQEEESKAKLEAEIKLERLREESKQSIIPKVEKLLDVYDSLATPRAKNEMLKEVLEKVVYIKNNGGRWHYSPDDFEITLYPKLPKV